MTSIRFEAAQFIKRGFGFPTVRFPGGRQATGEVLALEEAFPYLGSKGIQFTLVGRAMCERLKARLISGLQLAIVLGWLSFLPSAIGGTVIVDNLPTNTAIVNIDARQDGSATYNGDLSLWYRPFSSGGAAPPEYTVQPGAYTFRVVDPAHAAGLFPALTAAQTNLIFTAWTYNAPWVTDYLVFDSAALTNSSIPQIFDGAPGPSFASATAAYNGAVSGGFYNQIRAGPSGRAGTVLTTVYRFSSPETLVFVIPDNGLGDNAGGVSVLVSPAGPVLTIVAAPTAVTLEWPANASGFVLEQRSDLGSAPWESVATVPTLNGASYTVTLPLASATMFFRLHLQ